MDVGAPDDGSYVDGKLTGGGVGGWVGGCGDGHMKEFEGQSVEQAEVGGCGVCVLLECFVEWEEWEVGVL